MRFMSYYVLKYGIHTQNYVYIIELVHAEDC